MTLRCTFCGSPAEFLPPRWFGRWRKLRPHHAGGVPCPGRTGYEGGKQATPNAPKPAKTRQGEHHV